MKKTKKDQVKKDTQADYRRRLEELFKNTPDHSREAFINLDRVDLVMQPESESPIAEILGRYIAFKDQETAFNCRAELTGLIARSLLLERRHCQEIAMDWAQKAMDSGSPQASAYCSEIVWYIGRRPIIYFRKD